MSFAHSINFSRIVTLILLNIVFCMFLCSCIYRMDVQQGNEITPEMIQKLKPGMSKDAVKEIFGSPSLPHVLDSNRFDYYFSLVPGRGGKRIEKHFTVYFKNGKVVNWTSESH